jgi:formylglycine-generating enzyme required for sulfatase activity
MKLEEVKEDLGQGLSLEMVLIPTGTFVMGSPESEEDRNDDEVPHLVTLTKPYYMGKYAVTQEQWEAVMGNTSSEMEINSNHMKGAKLPVTDVSWEDCQDFIKELNEKTSGKFRLPTEAEWEYACRAGTTTAYSFGDRLTKSNANFDGASLKVVGSYKPNAFGLHDMHGNVWEWCEDWYGDYPSGSVTDPKGQATGTSHVLRGGSFVHSEWGAFSYKRSNGWSTYRIFSNGFRLARTK